MNVEIAKPPLPGAPPPPPPGERLEVLPPAGVVAAAAPTVRTPAPVIAFAPPAAQQAAAPPAPKPAPTPDPPREMATAAPTGTPVPAASGSPTSFACRDAPSRARAMVCEDPRLAGLDRRMKRAYADALGAGVNEAVLRDDQADWMDIREDAARYSRGAVVNVYRQRIDELERMADEPR